MNCEQCVGHYGHVDFDSAVQSCCDVVVVVISVDCSPLLLLLWFNISVLVLG